MCNNNKIGKIINQPERPGTKKFTQIEINGKNQFKVALLHTRTISTIYFNVEQVLG